MKKSLNFGLALASLLSLQPILAQESLGTSETEFIIPQKHHFMAGYSPGIPFYQLGSRALVNRDADQFRLKNSGSIGTINLGYEYRVSRSFSMGITGYYSHFSSLGTMIEDSSNLESTARYTINRFRVQARFNYLFKVSDPDLDIYIGCAVGTNKRFNSLFINEVRSDDSELPIILTLPFSMRAYFGMRYTIYRNLGLHIEFGFGGPTATFGINYRF
ncbi:MAG: hypothetical protein A3D31_01990 [Candidatus Fluviicola riflensis]|nr:MAG: hypothetical protein CHH17_13045 [Candidatus Fluviicola riflensis]OGS78768.1 MAG: hypothetical protein A3D31_01990 [Candidatus Fluviicola riflensis]OGS86199.1 MAG: hypothetical protein A2724_01445 [Fluviicola sp. RIFCSPHIGHO2_01_FULL_43_53]OGS87730.1 MAG: hypothetical protein A3E30_16655 [Fluviicola sp. RIFCSPHIGHO2_12_FULL_43_24]